MIISNLHSTSELCQLGWFLFALSGVSTAYHAFPALRLHINSYKVATTALQQQAIIHLGSHLIGSACCPGQSADFYQRSWHWGLLPAAFLSLISPFLTSYPTSDSWPRPQAMVQGTSLPLFLFLNKCVFIHLKADEIKLLQWLWEAALCWAIKPSVSISLFLANLCALGARDWFHFDG